MLFMVVERFRNGDPAPVYRRFQEKGRMVPDGESLTYLGSWVDAAGGRCFQLMECAELGALQAWVLNWSDLVDFEIVPVMPSKEFSALMASRLAPALGVQTSP